MKSSILDSISSPEDLKNLSFEELGPLCTDCLLYTSGSVVFPIKQFWLLWKSQNNGFFPLPFYDRRNIT